MKSNLECYVSSMVPVNFMLKSGLLTKDEYIKAELMLAEKYCIKLDNLHRPNDLIINGFRVMYITGKKEEKDGTKDNPNKRITAIGTKD